MKKRIGIAAAMVLSAAPVWAQPTNIGTIAPSDALDVAELERAIGGRTTLQLKFKDLTSEAVAEIIGQESGLRFVATPQKPKRGISFPFLRRLSLNTEERPEEAPTWNGDVDKTDFWLALRKWGRAENLRLHRERAALQQSQKSESSPVPFPRPEEQTTPEEMEKFWQQQNEWRQQRLDALERLNPNVTLGALYNAGTTAWNLVPDSELIVGDAVNVWPCLVLATRFQRQQNFSIRAAETPENLISAADNPAPPDTTTPDTAQTAQTVQAPVTNERGEEATAGGFVSDALLMNLEIYLEPKLRGKATVRVRVNEARDETGENLLSEEAKRFQTGGSVVSYGNFGAQDSRTTYRLSLLPRQAKGRKIATLKGAVTIGYPLKAQQHEITDLDGPQTFSLNTVDLPVAAQFEPPQVKNGNLIFSTAVNLTAERGARRLLGNFIARQPGENIDKLLHRSTAFAMSGRPSGDVAYASPLGQMLLPDDYTFIDSDGRTWVGRGSGVGATFTGPDGKPVPVTSPPTPLPDNFIYSEKRSGYLQLLSEAGAADPNLPPKRLTPEELAKVRFVKATFTSQFDWRTIEVPFEFHNLPLPPR